MGVEEKTTEGGNSGDVCTFGSEEFNIRFVTERCLSPFSSAAGLTRTACSFFPILYWLPRYKWRDDLAADVVAGLTTGVMQVPQGIAYAILSGVPPVNGLYAAFFAPLIYLFFGTSRHASVGSFAVVALMAGVTNEKIFSKYHLAFEASNSSSLHTVDDASPTHIASTLTFAVGLVQLASAVLKLDFIATYFSDPLVSGFSTGAAVHVLFSQIDDILGITLERASGAGYLFKVAYWMVLSIPLTNLVTLFASLAAGVFLIAGKDYISPLVNRHSPAHVVVPYDLFVLVLSTAVSYIFGWGERYDVPIVGEVPTGLPLPTLPTFWLLPDCIATAGAIAVVTIAVHLSMAKILAKRFSYEIDPSQELYALGISSTCSGFFPVYPASTALGRTMVNVESGARTQLSIVFGSVFLLAVILFVGPLFRTLPLCILSTVIVVSLRPMFRKFKELSRLWHISKYDWFIWLASFVATVVIDVIGGLLVSIALALITVVVRTQRARWSSTIHQSPGGEASFCVYRFESPLLFTNAQHFLDSVRGTVKNWKKPLEDWKVAVRLLPGEGDTRHQASVQASRKLMIMDFSTVTEIDSMGLSALKEALTDLEDEEIGIALTSTRGSIRKLLLSEEGGISLDESVLFPSVQQAVASSKLVNVATGISHAVSTL